MEDFIIGFYGNEQRKRKLYLKTCTICGNNYRVPKHFYESSRFCSRKCFYTSQTNGLVHNCDFCQKQYVRKPSSVKNSKSGFLFCSRECKDQAQQLGDKRFESMRPSHYNEGQTSYRQVARRNYAEKCYCCGYSEILEILEVHHIDLDRTNNDKSNLRIVCPTCHEAIHFLSQTGKWRRKR